MVFNLKILLNLCDLGKYFLTSFRNTLPMFVLTFKIYGGLNHMTFPFLFHLVFSTGALNFIINIPAVFQSWLVESFSLNEFIFITWQIWNMAVGHQWQLVDDGKWMVWLRMNVEKGVIRLPIREKIFPPLGWMRHLGSLFLSSLY